MNKRRRQLLNRLNTLTSKAEYLKANYPELRIEITWGVDNLLIPETPKLECIHPAYRRLTPAEEEAWKKMEETNP
jgi:hypothetical protein